MEMNEEETRTKLHEYLLAAGIPEEYATKYVPLLLEEDIKDVDMLYIKEEQFKQDIGIVKVAHINRLMIYAEKLRPKPNDDVSKRLEAIEADHQALKKKFKDSEANYENMKSNYEIIKTKLQTTEDGLKETQAKLKTTIKDLDEFRINHGLTVIGEAALRIMGAYGDRKCKTPCQPLTKLNSSSTFSLPDINPKYFTAEDAQVYTTNGPTQRKVDVFNDGAYELKCTFSHEGSTTSPQELKTVYDYTVEAMKRSPELEAPLRAKRIKLFKNPQKKCPTFDNYCTMKPYF